MIYVNGAFVPCAHTGQAQGVGHRQPWSSSFPWGGDSRRAPCRSSPVATGRDAVATGQKADLEKPSWFSGGLMILMVFNGNFYWFNGWWMVFNDWLVVTGTWLLFFHILGIVIDIDVHIFQRGWNHQPVLVYGKRQWISESESFAEEAAGILPAFPIL